MILLMSYCFTETHVVEKVQCVTPKQTPTLTRFKILAYYSPVISMVLLSAIRRQKNIAMKLL